MTVTDVKPARGPLRPAAPTSVSRGLCGLLIGAALFGCDEAPEPAAPVPVKVRVLDAEEVIASSRFSGSVEALQSTDLAFKLAGTVRSLYRPANLNRDVQVGDVLAKGTVIAELDDGDLRRAKASAEARVAQLEARVATARDSLDIATRVLQRFEESSGSVSEVALDDALAKRVSAAGELAAAEHALADMRVQLDQANDNFANRQLIVPFDNATVAEKRIESGERKAAHEVAFRLIDISTVHVSFGVPDTMIGDPALGWSSADGIHLGKELRVTADAIEGHSLVAKVTKIAPQADALTRSFSIELTLDNPRLMDGERLLRPGMIVTVHVGTEQDRSLMLLPMSAIHRGRSMDELIVYEALEEDGREVVRARRVLPGGVYDNQVEVLPGSELQPGSQVVVTTAERLTEGVIVRVMQKEAL